MYIYEFLSHSFNTQFPTTKSHHNTDVFRHVFLESSFQNMNLSKKQWLTQYLNTTLIIQKKIFTQHTGINMKGYLCQRWPVEGFDLSASAHSPCGQRIHGSWKINWLLPKLVSLPTRLYFLTLWTHTWPCVLLARCKQKWHSTLQQNL